MQLQAASNISLGHAGRVVIVTGAGSGIGRATALLFAQEGAAVSIVDINHEQGASAVREIEAAGGRAIGAEDQGEFGQAVADRQDRL